jgi:surfeit locus 1 family protein
MISPQSSVVRPAAPAWVLTVLVAALAIAFVALGRWQWRRAEASAAQREAFARGADAVQVLGSARLADVARFRRISMSGRYRPERQFLLDNRTHGGSAGYEVLTPLELADGRTVLIDRGWVAFTGSRARLPDIAFGPPALVTVVGRVSELPSAGLAYGRAPPALEGDWPRLTSYPRMPELAAAFGRALEQRIVLLDAAQPYGYLREWQPPGLPPERHRAYAIQWWLFAAVLVAIWAMMRARRTRPKP